MSILKKFVIIAAFMTMGAGCGGAKDDGFIIIKLDHADLTAGLPDLAAEASQSALSLDLLKVARFQVTVSAVDIDPPVVATADAGADQIEVKGVPYGDNRTILVEALNSQGDVLRRRRLEGIEIQQGVVSDVQGRWNTVPIALNLRSGGIVTAERFHVIGFGEPGSPVRVSSEAKAGPVSFDLSNGEGGIVVSPSLSSGVFNFRRKPTALGKQTITLKDENNGESSSMTIYVVEGELPGRRLASGGGLGPTMTIGSAFGGGKTGNFPLVLKALTQKGKKKSAKEGQP